MEEVLKNFSEQLVWEPKIENGERLARGTRVFLCGMGGSRLAGDLARALLPLRDIAVHADFGVPAQAGTDTLLVASSYSGSTEEALDSFGEAGRRNVPRAVIAAGGKLLELARKELVPTVEIPEKGLPPRLAVGYATRALLSLLHEKKTLGEIAAASIHDGVSEDGKMLAERLKNTVPLVYSSRRMGSLSYYWKVVLNETAKMFAFANVFPEAGHNEIEGFEDASGTRIACLALKDPGDGSRIEKRMELFGSLCEKRKIPFAAVSLEGVSVGERVFRSVILANWTAYHIAQSRGVNPASTPLIDEWKNKLRG